jgi:multicomponent Na+:H+ antiporter subunit G
MSPVLDAASAALLVLGGLACLVGAFGMLRLPDFYTRLHAASLAETLGAGGILAGLALQAGWSLVSAKLCILGLLIFFTCPAATHALARAALGRGLAPQLAPEEAPSKP